MALLPVWLFLTVTKLKSFEVPESDCTSSASGCGPCWESVPPKEVLVFTWAVPMAVAPPRFSVRAWDSLFGLFFRCVFLFTSSFHRTGGCFLFASIRARGQEFTFSGSLPSPRTCVRGRPRAGCVGGRAVCFLHCSPPPGQALVGGQGGVSGVGFASDYAVLT